MKRNREAGGGRVGKETKIGQAFLAVNPCVQALLGMSKLPEALDSRWKTVVGSKEEIIAEKEWDRRGQREGEEEERRNEHDKRLGKVHLLHSLFRQTKIDFSTSAERNRPKKKKDACNVYCWTGESECVLETQATFSL